MLAEPATPRAVNLLRDGCIALARMEAAGIRVDVPYLDKAITDLDQRIRTMESALKKDEVWKVWHRRFGASSNIDSTQQLTDVIFGVLKFTPTAVTYKTNRAKGDEQAFRDVDLPFIRDYFQVKKLKNARGTFLEGIRREVVDGYVHPFFNLHLVETFRSSGDSPNVMNQPNRMKEIAEIIRRSYVPRPGNCFAEIDFSSMEFKGASAFWADAEMVRYASDPKADVHRDKAAVLFKCKPEEVSKEMRHLAKNLFVFPILYGSWWKKCAPNIWDSLKRSRGKATIRLKDGDPGMPTLKHLKRQGIVDLGITDSYDPRSDSFALVVKKAEEEFNKNFPGFGEGKERWWAEYQSKGWFRIPTGFVISGVYSRNFLMNAPIQGSCFHLLLWSLIELDKWLRKHKMKCKIVAEIHDCLLLDCPPDELQDVLTAAKWIMTEGVRKAWDWVIVPLQIEVDITGENESWFSKKPWHCIDGIWKPKEQNVS